MDFIFMLTRDDRTIADCVEVYESIRELPVRHVGFKDVGVAPETLARLHALMKADVKTTYMEVVSTTPEACLASAAVGARLGVDCLLGGTRVADVLAVLKGRPTGYYPFPGIPRGHPTRLGGSPERIAADTRAAVAAGCAGVDLLAYRATEADPLDLVRAARGATDRTVIVAGSVDTPERIRAVKAAGADLFTIGTAALSGGFDPRYGLLANQLRRILDAAASS
jgi:hypothetical protein